MVSRAGRDLLKNTIRTVDHHNRVLEEQIMWNLHGRKSGDTNEDEINSKKRKRVKKEKVKMLKSNSNLPKTLGQKITKWDHSGFLELYPEVAESEEKSQSIEKKHKMKTKDKKKKKKKRKKKIESPSSQSSDTSVEEVWVEKTS